MKKKNKIHFIFIALSILFLTTSIYLNINTTSSAKERIITEINNKPIVVDPAIEEIEEPETGEVVEEEEITNSYTNTELSIIIITSIVSVICLLNIITTKFGTKSLIESLSTSKALIYYTIFLVLLTTTVTLSNVILTDKRILNGPETKERHEKSLAIIEIKETMKGNSITETSKEQDTSIIQVSNQATYTGEDLNLTKESGETTDKESSIYYGLNSAVIVKDGSSIELIDSDITTNVSYSSAFFLTGLNGTAKLDNINISTNKEYSSGLVSSDYGSITALDLDITTKGDNSTSLKSITSNSEINIEDSYLYTEGLYSPLIYSSGKIILTNTDGTALNSNIATIEGSNSITLTDSKLTTENITNIDNTAGIYIYNEQSKSISADYTNATFTSTSSRLTIKETDNYESIPMFYITNIKATINITDTELDYSNNILLKVVGNDTYGDIGNNGGEVTFTATDQELKGNIEIDDISKVRFNLNNSHYEGQINGNDSSKAVDITFDKTSTWTLTGDSYINTLTIQNGKISRLSRSIKSNGYDIYYNANLNEWLNGKTIRLSGGGKLIPVFYES